MKKWRELGTLKKISAICASCKGTKPSWRTARVQGHFRDYQKQLCLFQVCVEGSCMICSPMRVNLPWETSWCLCSFSRLKKFPILLTFIIFIAVLWICSISTFFFQWWGDQIWRLYSKWGCASDLYNSIIIFSILFSKTLFFIQTP